MKKAILVIATVASIALIGTQAFAWRFWGGPMAWFSGDTYAGCNYWGSSNGSSPIQQELAAKQGEYDALMATPNPDPNRAEQLNRDIRTLQDQLRGQGRSYRLPAASANYGYGRTGGCGWRW